MQKGTAARETIIDLIYQCAYDPCAWTELLTEICRNQTHQHGIIHLLDNQSNTPLQRIQYGLDDTFRHTYLTQFHDLDIWAQRLFSLPQGHFFADHKVVDRKRYLQSTFHNELHRQFDIHFATGAHWTFANRYKLRLSFVRNRQAGRFTQQSTHYLNSLTTHLQRTLRISGKLAIPTTQTASLLAKLGSTNQCLGLFNLEGKLLEANAAMERLLANEEQIGLRNNAVYFSSPIPQRQFYLALNAAKYSFNTQHSSQQLMLGQPFSNSCYQGTITPIRLLRFPSLGVTETVVILTLEPYFCCTPENQLQLQKQLGLTRKEAYLCLQLATGKSIQTIAAESRRSEHTVRSQIKSIQRKLNTSSQAGIVGRTMLTFSNLRPQPD